MIDLRRLHVLRVLHQHGTITATAATLHLTPSAVSQQLRQLSHEIGRPLLAPEGRRVQLTPAAHILLEHADQLCRQWEQARADLAAADDAHTGYLRLCGVPTAVAALLAPAATSLHRTHPRLSIQLTEAETLPCFDLLLAGHADIATVVATPDGPSVDDPRFDQRPILDDPLDLVVSANHHLAHRDTIELVESCHEAWILPVAGIDHREVMLTACAAAGFAPRVAHTGSEWPAVIAMVSHGLGVCLIPRLAPLPAHASVVRIPLAGTPAPARRILACMRRGSHQQPPIANGLEALHAVARQLPPPLIGAAATSQGDQTPFEHRHRHAAAPDTNLRP